MMSRDHYPRFLISSALAALLSVAACGGDEPRASTPDAAAPTADADVDAPPVITGEDLDMRAEDFTCIKTWDMVRHFRISNKLGHLDEALAVANAPQGKTYPVGTIIQLVPFEAMVKRGKGFSAESNDWEFFALTVNAQGTTINARGGDSTVLNQFNRRPCLECHSPAKAAYDFVCDEETQQHGCMPLGVPIDIILRAQNGDARCPPQP